jgi:hypothetical protein
LPIDVEMNDARVPRETAAGNPRVIEIGLKHVRILSDPGDSIQALMALLFYSTDS